MKIPIYKILTIYGTSRNDPIIGDQEEIIIISIIFFK